MSQGEMAARRLPFNRKERYFTGTVLPGVIAGGGLSRLSEFLDLCGLGSVAQPPVDPDDLQFFTEYNFAESVHRPRDKRRWPNPVTGDTPDLVLTGPEWLLVVEAKMYHRPSAHKLLEQVDRQRDLIDEWVRTLALDRARVAHVLLLPRPLEQSLYPKIRGAVDRVVTWEDVLERFGGQASDYWLSVLHHALDSYPALVSQSTSWGANADARLSGQTIIDKHSVRSRTQIYTYIGRQSGLMGKPLADDIGSGGWRNRMYEVRVEALQGKTNWFPISQFRQRLIEAGEISPG